MRLRLALVGIASLFSAGSACAATITLQFVPQERTGAPAPALPEYLRKQGVKLQLEDGRAQKSWVGSLSDDDDRVIALHASGDVVRFASGVLERTARQWGVKDDKCGCITLHAKLTQFSVRESDWPFGSTYKANAGLSYVLTDALGRNLASGTVSGDASRFGQSQSKENCNEVLSDALKEAFARLLDRRSLDMPQATHATGSDGGRTRIAPAALLAELRKLKGQGSSNELLIAFVAQHHLSAALSAKDFAAWKGAGMPEPVLLAAMKAAR